MSPYVLPGLYLAGAVAAFVYVASDVHYRQARGRRIPADRNILSVFGIVFWPLVAVSVIAGVAGLRLWRVAGTPGRMRAAREDRTVQELTQQRDNLRVLLQQVDDDDPDRDILLRALNGAVADLREARQKL